MPEPSHPIIATSPPGASLKVRLITIVLPLAAGIVTLLSVWFWAIPAGSEAYGFPLDDAWIHMVYARELSHTGLLAYNPGIPATGATSPLWIGILALIHCIAGDSSVNRIIVSVYAIGCICFLACIFLLSRLTYVVTGKNWAGAIAGSLLAVSPPMAAAAYSGMEVLVCAALLLAAFLAFHRNKFWLSGGAIALGCLTRPEVGIVLMMLAVVVFRGSSRQPFIAVLLPSIVAGALWCTNNYLATDHLLPATFYMKENAASLDLIQRFGTAVTDIVDRIPPFWSHLAWIGVAGFFFPGEVTRPRTYLPLLGGLLMIIGNVAIVRPVDPAAFYHQRYIMPAVPLLIAGCIAGGISLTQWLGKDSRFAGGAFLIIGAAGSLITLPTVSAHMHNDIRNINEVQRAMGEWIGSHTEPHGWIAASDAGAIRYFSARPTIDLMGLNTPEIIWNSDEWIKSHPVNLLAFMPAWLSVTNKNLTVVRTFTTHPYTVTSYPAMATQIIAECADDSVTTAPRLDFVGMRSVSVYCRPMGQSKKGGSSR